MKLLTEPQWRTLRREYDNEPGQRLRHAVYPPARLRATTRLPSGQVITAPTIPTASGASGLSAGTLPQVRLWTFHIGTNASTRANLASPKFRGPALIAEFRFFMLTDTSAGTSNVFTAYLASSPAANGNGLAVTVVPPGINMLDLSYTDNAGFAAPATQGIATAQEAVSHDMPTMFINRPVLDSVFYINLSVIASAGGGMYRGGLFRIIEGIDPGQLAAFL
jgi:hypothetical protein